MQSVQQLHQRRLSSFHSGLSQLSGAIHEELVGTSSHDRKRLAGVEVIQTKIQTESHSPQDTPALFNPESAHA
jgi:hypothetical protein